MSSFLFREPTTRAYVFFLCFFMHWMIYSILNSSDEFLNNGTCSNWTPFGLIVLLWKYFSTWIPIFLDQGRNTSSWILEFIVLKFQYIHKMGIYYSLGTIFPGLAYPWNHENWYPTNNSTFTVFKQVFTLELMCDDCFRQVLLNIPLLSKYCKSTYFWEWFKLCGHFIIKMTKFTRFLVWVFKPFL